MKTQKNILIAFILNLCFSVFELVGGMFTGSIAVISDSVHDMGDALSIGISFFLELKSKKQPDETYTYGYMRYSVIGSVITTLILIFGSVTVIINAVSRIINPVQINYGGMIVFAVIGVTVNIFAAYFTREGDSLNQRAVNLHMLEDVLGWIVVLIGAVVMRFTDISVIDPIMSIGVAVFILINAVKNMKQALDLFLEKTPDNISVKEIKNHVMEIKGVKGVHHIHLWSMDAGCNYATMHVVTDEKGETIKTKIKHELSHLGISHTTLELESSEETCLHTSCEVEHSVSDTNHHHHHH